MVRNVSETPQHKSHLLTPKPSTLSHSPTQKTAAGMALLREVAQAISAVRTAKAQVSQA